jgi:hypothetical protein
VKWLCWEVKYFSWNRSSWDKKSRIFCWIQKCKLNFNASQKGKIKNERNGLGKIKKLFIILLFIAFCRVTAADQVAQYLTADCPIGQVILSILAGCPPGQVALSLAVCCPSWSGCPFQGCGRPSWSGCPSWPGYPSWPGVPGGLAVLSLAAGCPSWPGVPAGQVVLFLAAGCPSWPRWPSCSGCPVLGWRVSCRPWVSNRPWYLLSPAPH